MSNPVSQPARKLTILVSLIGMAAVCGACGAISPNRTWPAGAHFLGARIGPAARSEPDCTLYVAPHGSSSGATAASPTSLNAALSRAGPGSVVCLKSGTYLTQSNVMLARSGRPSAPIYYRGLGRALIQYRGGSLSGGVLQTVSGPGWRGSHDLVIDGLTIDGRNLIGSGIFISQGSHHVTIRNCVIRNTGAAGISVNASDYATVDHNQIWHFGYNQGWSSGISLWYGGGNATYGGRTAWLDSYSGFHNLITNNVVSGGFDNSIHHSDGGGIIVDGTGLIPPVLIANNISFENGGPGFLDYRNRGEIWYVNNTAYANGLDLPEGHGRISDFVVIYGDGVHWVNNLAYGRKSGSRYSTAYLFNDTGSKIAWSRNAGFNGQTIGVAPSVYADRFKYVYADPRFTQLPAVSPSSKPWSVALPPWKLGSDFVLQPGSPALAAGIDPAAAGGLTPLLMTTIRSVLP